MLAIKRKSIKPVGDPIHARHVAKENCSIVALAYSSSCSERSPKPLMKTYTSLQTPNDQAELQADRVFRFHSSRRSRKEKFTSERVRMKVPTQSPPQSVTGTRQPDCRKEHALLTDSIYNPGQS